MSPKIGFIGGGIMAEAMIEGVLARTQVTPEQITVAEPIVERRRRLVERTGVRATEAEDVEAAQASIVILSVKPQQLHKVFETLRGKIAPDSIVLSIAAGVRIDTIQAALQHRVIARAIPNLPARVSLGATVWTVSPEATREQAERVRMVLEAIGLQLEVNAEKYVEMATGFSGPMPAFVYLIVEALVEAGVGLGLTSDQALALTTQTIAGSVELLRRTGEHAAILRGHVTSPGGATSAGIYELEKAGLRTAFSDAVRAVYRRALELGKE